MSPRKSRSLPWLSEAKEDVFRLAAGGLTNEEIAHARGVKRATVQIQLSQVHQVLSSVLPREIHNAILGSLASPEDQKKRSGEVRHRMALFYREYARRKGIESETADRVEFTIRVGSLERSLRVGPDLAPDLIAYAYMDILVSKSPADLLLALAQPLRAEESRTLVSRLQDLAVSTPQLAQIISRNLVDFVDMQRKCGEPELLFAANQGCYYAGCLKDSAPLEWLLRVATRERDNLLRTAASLAAARLGRPEVLENEIDRREYDSRADSERVPYWMSYAGDQGFAGYPPRDLGRTPIRAMRQQISDVLGSSSSARLHLHELVVTLEERPHLLGRYPDIDEAIKRICSFEDPVQRRQVRRLEKIIARGS